MSFTLWFTGLSGAGKTTLSRQVYLEIRRRSLRAELLDGDLIRVNFSQELTFTKRDRDINVRRIGFVSHLLNKNQVISVVAAIAPYETSRRQNRALIKDYVEVFVNCPLDVCEERDVKGLYAKARSGEIKNFTGVSDPYEPPSRPDIELRTDRSNITQCVRQVLDHLEERHLLPMVEECERCNYSVQDEDVWRQRLAKLGYAKSC